MAGSKEKKKVNRAGQTQIIKKVLRYLGRYRIFLWASLLLALITVVMQLYIPKITGTVVDYMAGKGQVDFDGVVNDVVKVIIAACIAGLAQWLQNLCNNKMTYDVVKDIRNDAFDKIEKLPLSYIDSHPVGEMESRVIADADQFADGLLMGFTQLFTGVITIAGTLIFMISIDGWIALAVVALTPLSFVVAGFISKRSYKMFRRQSELRGEQTGFINEMVEGQKVVKAFNREEYEIKGFCESTDSVRRAQVFAEKLVIMNMPIMQLVMYATIVAIMWFGGNMAVKGDIQTGQLSSFIMYVSQILMSLMMLSMLFIMFVV